MDTPQPSPSKRDLSADRHCPRCNRDLKEADFGNKKSYCRSCDCARARNIRAHMTEAKYGQRDGTTMSLVAFKAKKGLGRKVDEMFDSLVKKRMVLFQCDGLDALHDLAMMPVSDNSAQNNIKYLAASKLAQSQLDKESEGSLDAYLKELNASYQQAAPRIKQVRERIVTFDDGSEPPKLVN